MSNSLNSLTKRQLERNSSSLIAGSCSSMLAKRTKTTISSVPNDDLQIHLPSEILSLIFEFLPLRDRKSIRQTCKLWNESSKIGFFAKKEKFVFRKNQDNIARILSTSIYPFINLEFQGLKTEYLSNNIWKKFGYKIQSLHFHCCDLDPKTVELIILHCVNLASLQIHKSYQHSRHNNISILIKILEGFIRKGIKRPELKTFSAQFCDEISCDWWKDLFAIFPNVKYFGSTLFVSKVRPFKVERSLQLESLTLYNEWEKMNLWDEVYEVSLDNAVLLDGSKLPLLWMFKLKEFRTNLRNEWTHPSMNSWFAFFSWQSDLEVIDLHIDEAIYLKSFLFHILECCPKLRELRICCHPPDFLMLNLEEAKKFFLAISNLENLHLFFKIEINTLPVLPSLKMALRSLTVWNNVGNTNCNAFILNHSLKLESLQIIAVTDDIIDLIFKTQAQLRSLRFISYFGSSLSDVLARLDEDDSGEKMSIQQLQKLEFLEIISRRGVITKKLISEFKFQRLKILKLWVPFKDVSHTDLCKMFLCLPQLQIVNLHFGGEAAVDVDKIDYLCKNAKNLTSLLISPISSCTMDKWKCLFEKNSNLRYIINRDEFLHSNPFTQLSQHSQIKNFRFPSNIYGLFDPCRVICEHFNISGQ